MVSRAVPPMTCNVHNIDYDVKDGCKMCAAPSTRDPLLPPTEVKIIDSRGAPLKDEPKKPNVNALGAEAYRKAAEVGGNGATTPHPGQERATQAFPPIPRPLTPGETTRQQRAHTILDAIITADDMKAPSAEDIIRVALKLAKFLLEKNAAYGESALDPVRVMSKADPIEQIKVRMDDKLSRMMRGHAGGEDAMKDLVGYWVLLQVAEQRRRDFKELDHD